MENKAQDAAYPGKVIVTYPSIIDYASSQVGGCENIVISTLLKSKTRYFRSFRGVSEAFYEGDPTNFRRIGGV